MVLSPFSQYNNVVYCTLIFMVLVNGGLTEWSEWGRCDKLCENGKQRRHKTCTDPKPRCGGRQCDTSVTIEDERPCMYCPGECFIILSGTRQWDY